MRSAEALSRAMSQRSDKPHPLRRAAVNPTVRRRKNRARFWKGRPGSAAVLEAYAADDHCLGLFPTPRAAAAAITMARPWVARTTAEYSPELSRLAHLQSGGAEALG